jgi:hypothetical protein
MSAPKYISLKEQSMKMVVEEEVKNDELSGEKDGEESEKEEEVIK